MGIEKGERKDLLQDLGPDPHVSYSLSGETRRLIYEGEGKERLDRFLAQRYDDLTRSQVKRLLAAGHVLVSGKKSKASTLLRHGDLVAITIPPSPPSQLEPEKISLEVIFEDSYLMVINKPAGLVVHPGPGHTSGTLAHALLAHCPGINTVGGPQRAGLVHRLDKDTSGVLVVAKAEAVHRHLAQQFKDRLVHKEYLTLVHGRLRETSGTICLPLGRDLHNRKQISHRTRKPRTAITHWRVLRWFPHWTLLRVKTETGRTHQIRVHLASIHHPVVGDPLYGRRIQARQHPRPDNARTLRSVHRQFLHAACLSFQHPKSNINYTFRALLPPDLLEILRFLGHIQEETFDSSKHILV